MITLVLVAAAALMLTSVLMRGNASRARRGRDDGIRWRGIDWSRKRDAERDEEKHEG